MSRQQQFSRIDTSQSQFRGDKRQRPEFGYLRIMLASVGGGQVGKGNFVRQMTIFKSCECARMTRYSLFDSLEYPATPSAFFH